MYKLKYKESIDRWNFEPEVQETTFPDTVSLDDIEELLTQIPWFELYKDETLVLHKHAKYVVYTGQLIFFCVDTEEVNALCKMFHSGDYEDYDNSFHWDHIEK